MRKSLIILTILLGISSSGYSQFIEQTWGTNSKLLDAQRYDSSSVLIEVDTLNKRMRINIDNPAEKKDYKTTYAIFWSEKSDIDESNGFTLTIWVQSIENGTREKYTLFNNCQSYSLVSENMPDGVKYYSVLGNSVKITYL